MGLPTSIIRNFLGFVKSIIKINPLFFIIPIIIIGIFLLLKRSRSWKESFADTGRIFKLLGKLGITLVSLFLSLFFSPFIKTFQEADRDMGV